MLSRFELRRFRGALPKLALIFAMLVPVIYGAVYLAANWDPYGNLDKLPVALVNQDVPTTYQGTRIQAGQDVQDELVDGHAFQWHVTSAADAEDGLRHGRYYLVLEIPADFSKNLVSGSTSDPQQARITVRRNDANGFVIGSVLSSAQNRIEEAVNQTAVDAYFKAVFKSLGELRTGIQQAHDGSAQVTAGLKTAKSGSAQLRSGIDQAASATGKLSDGANTLDASMPALTSGATSLKTGLDTLNSGSSTLATGAHQVAEGTQELYDTVAPVLTQIQAAQKTLASDVSTVNGDVQQINTQVNGSTGSVSSRLSSVSAQLDALAAADPQAAQTTAYKNARQQLSQAQTQVGKVSQISTTVASRSATINARVQQAASTDAAGDAKAKLGKLNTGAHQVATGADRLHTGIAQADSGAGQLASGVGKVAGGVGQLASGLTQLDTGMGKLQTGASQLDSGLGKLVTGSSKLTAGLGDALKKIPAYTSKQAEDAATVLSKPVDFHGVVENPANVYGRGLAPLFFSIAMWVFGISGFLVMRPISGRLLAGRLDPARLTFEAWLPFGVIGILGAFLMLFTVWGTLSLTPVHALAIIGLTLLTATVFSLIAHLLRTALGLPGSALLLVWLIVQLSSTGGTYPAVILPTFFRWAHPLMPITYTIDAYRVAISGGLWSRFTTDVLVLAAIGVLALLLDMLAVAARQRFRMTDLHPPLSH